MAKLYCEPETLDTPNTLSAIQSNGFVRVGVVGNSGDRLVTLLAINDEGELNIQDSAAGDASFKAGFVSDAFDDDGRLKVLER